MPGMGKATASVTGTSAHIVLMLIRYEDITVQRVDDAVCACCGTTCSSRIMGLGLECAEAGQEAICWHSHALYCECESVSTEVSLCGQAGGERHHSNHQG